LRIHTQSKGARTPTGAETGEAHKPVAGAF
jgi:hypothetical protein